MTVTGPVRFTVTTVDDGDVNIRSKWYSICALLTAKQPTAARSAFPCWDEPLLKATFAVTLVSRDDTTNLSNMPVVSEELCQASPADTKDAAGAFWAKVAQSQKEGVKWKVTKFETTPKMSTYIVAYANGHFEYLESSYTSPISGKVRPLRIYTTADGIHQAQFALDVKVKTLPLYEKVFEIEYPLPKLDTLVAHDFDAGAMENWGLITGRTSAFLLDPKSADMSAKKRVATTQSHEVAHMWFGNITTMTWWNYLYLNEGFATLMGEVIIADKVFPEWKVNSEFITEHLNDALSLDAKLSSHPIEVDCPDANQINQIFDSLSYAKAASVLRMLSNFVGEEKFLKGVSLYLKDHLFANSTTTDLWRGIEKATGTDVPKIMDNWISKMGFPVLTVTEDKDGVHVRQDRFLETGPAESKDNETIWTVPLSLLTVGHDGKPCVDRSLVLDKRETTLKVDTSKPFKLNAGTTGVFRVLYTPERLAKIAEEAAKGEDIFSLDDRIGLVHDAMTTARAGFAKMSSALNVMNILKNENEYLVWQSVAVNLGDVISTWWEQPKTLDLLNAFRRSLFAPLVRKLGYEYSDSDSADTTLLRTQAISGAALAKDESVVKELQTRFAEFMETGDDSCIPADIQRITFATAVKFGGHKEYEFVKNIYSKAKTPSQRIAVMLAMGATEDIKLAERTLRFTEDGARDQDVVYFFRGLSNNPKTRRLMVKHFFDNYDALYKRFEGNFTLKFFVEIILGSFSSEKDRQEFEQFFKDKDTSKYRLALEQALDEVNAKAKLLERSSDDVHAWLEQWNQGSRQ